MIAILKKTVGPNFRAGDVITGSHSRISKLHERGLVTLDHSMLSMIGNLFSIIFSSLFFWFVVLVHFKWMQRYIPVDFTFVWSLTFLFISSITILINTAYFLNAKIPYVTYFLSFTTNIFGGILIMAGHEKTSSRYQPSTISASAAIVLFTLSSILISIAVLVNVEWNLPAYFHPSYLRNFISWLFFILLFISGIIISMFYDANYIQRRKRYISFLKRKNATIEYKTKALNAYKAYQKSGNSDEFMKKNIELLEETLKIDRKQIVDKKEEKDNE